MNDYKNEFDSAKSGAETIRPVLSDTVKIEIIHSIKDVLIRLIDALYPRNSHSNAE